MPVVYTLPSCVQCTATKRRMDQKGIEYETVDLSTDEAASDFVKSLGYAAAPVVVAGESHWSGYVPDLIDALAA